MNQENLVQIIDLKKHYPVSQGIFLPKKYVKAVNGVSLEIKKGETFGLVGESGCGKSTLGKTLLRLIEPTAGKIIYDGKDVTNIKRDEMQRLRKEMQIIFQDPSASLNPRLTVGKIITQPLKVQEGLKGAARQEKAQELLESVGLDPVFHRRYAYEFSGGQKQRIGIARALSLNPSFILCDEPVSALDVSIQAQILNLLQELQEKFSLTYLFISHNLAVIKHISDRIGVMYLGNLVEVATNEQIYTNHLHPYTKTLIDTIPIPDPTAKKIMASIEGDVPNPINMPSGCAFHTRCKYCMDICKEEIPVLQEVEPGHQVACHLINKA